MPSLPQTGVWCARGRGKERKWSRVELTLNIVAAAKMLSMPPAAVMMMIGWWERCMKSSENSCERAAQLCNMHESNEKCAKMQSLRIMVQ